MNRVFPLLALVLLTLVSPRVEAGNSVSEQTISPEQAATLCLTKEGQAEHFGRWDEQKQVCTAIVLPKKQTGEYSIDELAAGSQGVTASDYSPGGAEHCDLCSTYCHGDLVCDPRCHYTGYYVCGTHSCNCTH